tara:strand:- start:134 stop:1471 length:1338 start_codon:yes stop_codon:yes gene_type:complete
MQFFKKNIHYLFFFVLVFIVEVIYFYPSPGVDSLWFLSLSFNICREDLFTGLRTVVYNRDAVMEEWVRHGWFMQYILAKFNLFCSIRGIYFFNFIIKIATSLAIYQILKNKEKNNFFLAIIIFCILLLQIKLEFRPETFSILLCSLIYLCFKSKRFFLVGSLIGILFFTQFIIMCFVGLFGLLFFYKDIFKIKNFFYAALGFLIFLILLDNIYPYSILDYINGLILNSGTRQGSGVHLITDNFYIWFKSFYEFFLFPDFIPLWGILFIIIYINIIINNFWVIITLPFIWFFGPHVPIGSYYLMGLTPLLLILQYENFNKINFFTKYKKIFFYFLTIFVFLSFTLIFTRNILTIIQHGNEIKYTKSFLQKNLEKIDLLPSFGSLLIQDWKLKNEENENFLYDLYSVNGSRNPCPDNISEKKDHAIYIFNYKIFNSNSGYGIYVCKK